jgi:tetratricopeptide (TPR) repeat protein
MGIILFDNDITVIEAGNVPDSDQRLVITFSSFGENDPLLPGFGQAFLEKNGCYVIAVKKRADNWYRDLNLQDFADVVMPFCDRSESFFTYGASMGGYAALYFASVINAQPIAISPRNSIDPRFFLPEYARFRSTWSNHDMALASISKPDIRPHVVFDPRVKADLAYINQEVRPAFPSGFYTEFAFSGHPSARAMSEVGHLKSFVVDALEGRAAPARLVSRAVKRRSATIVNEMSKWSLTRKRLNRASRLSEVAMKIGGEQSDFLYHKGALMIASGNLEEALTLTETMIGTHGRSASLFHRMASLSVRLGRLEQAIDASNAGLELSPGSIGLLRTRRNALEKMGHFERAYADGLFIINSGYGSASDHLHLSSLLMALKNYADALHHLDAAMADKASLLTLRRRRDCLDALARNYEAVEAAARVVSLAPRNAADILHLAHLNMRVRDLPGAIATLDNGISLSPNSVELYRRKRDYLVRADRLKDAVEAAISVVKIASNSSTDAAVLRRLRIKQLHQQVTMVSRHNLLRLQNYAIRIPGRFMSAEPIAILDTLVSTI